MLQTQKLKVSYKGTFKMTSNSRFLKMDQFKVGFSKYQFPSIITLNGENFEFDHKIFECQQEKFIYKSLSNYGSKITIW